jgi:hypothetical protein
MHQDKIHHEEYQFIVAHTKGCFSPTQFHQAWYLSLVKEFFKKKILSQHLQQ